MIWRWRREAKLKLMTQKSVVALFMPHWCPFQDPTRTWMCEKKVSKKERKTIDEFQTFLSSNSRTNFISIHQRVVVVNFFPCFNHFIWQKKLFFCLDYPHNPYNGVVCNDTITATGVFSSKELWNLSKGIILYWNMIQVFRHKFDYFVISFFLSR